jgi:mannosyltransferase
VTGIARWRQRLDGWPGLALLTLAALSLRFFHLGFRSIWLDEAYSLKLASASWGEILGGAAADIHPPLFHLLLGGWIRLFGTSEVAARSLSVLLGALLVPALFRLAAAVTQNRRAAWWSAGLAACSPYFIELSRSARMGALLALTSALALYFFWKFFEDGTLRAGAGFVAAMLAALYTHYFGFLVYFALHLFLFMGIGKLGKTRPWRQRWMFLQLHVLVGYSFWLPVLWRHLHLGGPGWRGTGAGWLEPLHACYGVLLGTACWSLMDKALALTALGLGAGTVLLGLAPRLEKFYTALTPRAWGFLATVLLAPLGIVLLYSWNRINVFDNRYLSMVGLMLLVALGLALASVPWRRAALASPLFLLAFALPVAHQYFVYGYYDNWRAAAREIGSAARPGDRVALYPAWNETPLAYYLHGRLPLQGVPGTYDPLSGETQNYFPIDPANVHHLQSLFKPTDRVWLVLVNEGEEQDLVRAWFLAHYRAGRVVKIGGIWIGLWEPRG